MWECGDGRNGCVGVVGCMVGCSRVRGNGRVVQWTIMGRDRR